MKKRFLFLSMAALTLAACSSSDDNATTPVEVVTPPSSGKILQPTVGGPNQPNQVYLDLSTESSTSVNRASWDFGFSGGSDFRVIINGSLKMAVKKLATNDITLPQVANTDVAVGGGETLASSGYVDNPTGVLAGAGNGEGTAIAEISATDANNNVYLVNLGFAISTTTPSVGSASTDGAERGWKKVRILRSGTGYKIQYADLASTTFTEKTVTKNADFNFTFFSLASGSATTVEPTKKKWDINFTTFTNYLVMGSGAVTYGFSDFIVTNMKGGTKVYQVLNSEGITFENFKLANVTEAKFAGSTTDQRIIGSNWRNGGSNTTLPSIKTDRFYVVKDADGNVYKVKFLAMTNDAGVRGYPTVQYTLLQ
ncbi:HmuY family protein [Flavobacterium sp. '19STA2R22 D10 B1']|uniref:HmuY family protein n=1 Tax=Flavobacterium aerium TaxID=3037261 RepID=UPI00278C1C40|nr:HmuY family protein [Flavobacterium sp. '19STA2R22 D10 B1']